MRTCGLPSKIVTGVLNESLPSARGVGRTALVREPVHLRGLDRRQDALLDEDRPHRPDVAEDAVLDLAQKMSVDLPVPLLRSVIVSYIFIFEVFAGVSSILRYSLVPVTSAER